MKRFSLLAAMLIALPASAANFVDGLKKGSPTPKSVGAMAFGPEGILFVADAKGMEIFAVATGDTAPGGKDAVKIEGIDAKIAAMLGSKVENISIKDMKVNPASGNVYLSVMSGSSPILLMVDRAGKIGEVAMKDVPFSSVQLKKVKEGSQRAESITGIVFSKDRLFVAALPNEEFASNLRSYSFPFEKGDDGITTEIYHGAHGRFETASPVQTLMALEIDGKPHVLAAYTCTPLVKFAVDDLKGGKKLRGTTVAELGNRNQPLDMISYQKDGKEYVLIANSARGVMKVSTDGIDKNEGIVSKINGTAGLKYETIADLKGVMQLDKLDDARALILCKNEKGLDLKSIDLP
jgi:hypothetical protein